MIMATLILFSLRGMRKQRREKPRNPAAKASGWEILSGLALSFLKKKDRLPLSTYLETSEFSKVNLLQGISLITSWRGVGMLRNFLQLTTLLPSLKKEPFKYMWAFCGALLSGFNSRARNAWRESLPLGVIRAKASSGVAALSFSRSAGPRESSQAKSLLLIRVGSIFFFLRLGPILNKFMFTGGERGLL